MDQLGKVANLARGELNRIKMSISLSPFAPEILVSRDRFSGVPSRVILLILHPQAATGAYSRASSRFPRQHPFLDTANYHRVSREYIGSLNCVPMAFRLTIGNRSGFFSYHNTPE